MNKKDKQFKRKINKKHKQAIYKTNRRCSTSLIICKREKTTKYIFRHQTGNYLWLAIMYKNK